VTQNEREGRGQTHQIRSARQIRRDFCLLFCGRWRGGRDGCSRGLRSARFGFDCAPILGHCSGSGRGGGLPIARGRSNRCRCILRFADWFGGAFRGVAHRTGRSGGRIVVSAGHTPPLSCSDTIKPQNEQTMKEKLTAPLHYDLISSMHIQVRVCS
jgi:hypothetical protein